jgi:hypothetical protein
LGYNAGVHYITFSRWLCIAASMTWIFASERLHAAPATTTTTTKAAQIPADQSTPRGALKLLARALETGDREKVLMVLYSGNALEKKIAAATADLAAANGAVRDAAIKAYGEEAAKKFVAGSLSEASDRIDSAAEKIDGDRATVNTAEDDAEPLTLIRVDGKWVIPLTSVATGVAQTDVDRNLEDVQAQIHLLRSVGDQIAQGKFKTVEEARAALDRELMQAAIKGSSTLPASAPLDAQP